MTNRIIIKNNTIESLDSKEIIIKNKELIIQDNCDYIIEYIDCNNINLNIRVKDNIVAKIFIFSKENNLKVNNHYILGKNSNLILFKFYDNLNVEETETIDLNGEYAKIYEGFSSISHGIEEYHTIVNHNKKNVESDIRNKCMGLDSSKIWIKIDSNLEKGNSDCIMNQETRILTLGDVDAKIIPNMFIEENDVEARHGSIIGNFSDDEIFYLMSRGISKEEAILLLIKGYLFSNIIVDYEKREYIMNSILNLRR